MYSQMRFQLYQSHSLTAIGFKVFSPLSLYLVGKGRQNKGNNESMGTLKDGFGMLTYMKTDNKCLMKFKKDGLDILIQGI